MANERLRATISAKGQTLQTLADHVGIDPKSVERWISKDRTPHRNHRWKAATFLGVDEVYLWPTVAKQAEDTSTSELITYYPHRGAVRVLVDVVNRADHGQVEDSAYFSACSCSTATRTCPTSWPTRPRPGAHVRILLGDPDSAMIHQRGEEEGIGDDLAARARITRRYLQPAAVTPGVEIRLHDTILYNSIYDSTTTSW